MITHSIQLLLGAIAQLLVCTGNDGLLEKLVASKVPVAGPGPAFAAFSAQVGVAQIEIEGLPVIFGSPPLLDRPSGLTVVARGSYPWCIDAAESRAEREIAHAFAPLPQLGPRSLTATVVLRDDDPDRSVPIVEFARWVVGQSDRRVFGSSLRPSTLDLMEVKRTFGSPSNGRFWVSLGCIWEVQRAVLDMPEPRGRAARVQLPLLVRPERGQVLFPFFAVADCTSVLWVEVSPKFCGVVLPCTTYLRASTADGDVCRVGFPPEFWRKRPSLPALAPLPEHAAPFTFVR